MFMVYWSEVGASGATPESKDFAKGQLTEVMAFMEGLRKRQREDGTVAFIAMSSENPDCVSLRGVDVTGPDYNWTKRRDTRLKKDLIDASTQK